MSQIVQQTNQLWAALMELNARVSRIETRVPSEPGPPVQSPDPVPAPPPPPEPLVPLQDLVNVELTHLRDAVLADGRAEMRKERAALEITLTHKYNQMIAKLVKDRCDTLQAQLEQFVEQAVEQATAPRPTIIPGLGPDPGLGLDGLHVLDGGDTEGSNEVLLLTKASSSPGAAKKRTTTTKKKGGGGINVPDDAAVVAAQVPPPETEAVAAVVVEE